MASFHLAQFEDEPFWQYLSTLNDYPAQYVHSCIKNKKYTMLCLRG